MSATHMKDIMPPNRRPQQPINPIVTLAQPISSLTYSSELVSVAPYASAGSVAQKRNIPIKRILKWFLITVLIVLLSGAGWVGWKFYSNVAKVTGDKNPLHLFSSVPLKNSNGHVNILLAGYSNDDPGHDGATLTDSIMVVSIDQNKNTALILSIPRDLWVHIPGDGYQKINAAYPYGESSKFSEDGYASGGMGLLEKIVSQDLGIDINYYALINYTAFKDAVNAVGGITVDLTSSDNPYGLYDPYTHLKLINGIVSLDGQTALNLARARGDGPGSYGFPRSDFNRTQHQRQMLVALKEKATSGGVISNPLKVGELADAAGNNVKTDIKTNEMESLFVLLKKVPANSITTVGLNDIHGKNLLKSYTGTGGVSALVPAAGRDDYRIIQQAIQDIINPPDTTSTSTTTGSSTN
jgi:LCP family protein required for cell wall assembly